MAFPHGRTAILFARTNVAADNIERTVITGSGPAGWSAAIYAAIANLESLLIEVAPKPEVIPLGQSAYTADFEDCLGFPNGTVLHGTQRARRLRFWRCWRQLLLASDYVGVNWMHGRVLRRTTTSRTGPN